MRNHILVIAFCCLYVALLSITAPLFLTVLATLALLALAIPLALRLCASLIRPTNIAENVAAEDHEPFVSIIMACANEPHTVVNPSLRALAKLQYKHYEVLVLDNNNSNENNYEQIKKACQRLGKRFKFQHVDQVTGFKAGALNLAMDYIDPKSEILAIVDADYRLKPDYLKSMTTYFADPCVGIVEAPQDYSDEAANPGLFYDYRAFFAVLMNQAQQFGAVTFTGTMGMIRRSLFTKKALHWNEWCITEDTEASVFIHSLGYKGYYVDRSFGRGVMPLSYASLLKQRARWAYGNAQILRKDLFPILINRSFSWRQKLSFASQLTAWMHIELALLFILATCVLNWALYHNPITLLVENLCLGLLAASLLVNLEYFLVGLRSDRLPIRRRLEAFVAHYGTALAMSYSWIYCFFGGEMSFKVTKKTKTVEPHRKAHVVGEAILPIVTMGALAVLVAQNQLNWALTVVPLFGLAIISLFGIWYLERRFNHIL